MLVAQQSYAGVDRGDVAQHARPQPQIPPGGDILGRADLVVGAGGAEGKRCRRHLLPRQTLQRVEIDTVHGTSPRDVCCGSNSGATARQPPRRRRICIADADISEWHCPGARNRGRFAARIQGFHHGKALDRRQTEGLPRPASKRLFCHSQPVEHRHGAIPARSRLQGAGHHQRRLRPRPGFFRRRGDPSTWCSRTAAKSPKPPTSRSMPTSRTASRTIRTRWQKM